MKLTIFSSFVFILLIITFISMHENVHKEIYRGYGIDAEIDYFSYFPYAVTIPEDNCPTEECELAHNINEVYGYQLQVVLALIGLLGIAVIFLLERIYEELRF